MNNALKIVGAAVVTGTASLVGGVLLLGAIGTALGEAPAPKPTHSVVAEHKPAAPKKAKPTHKATHKPAPKATHKSSPKSSATHKAAPKAKAVKPKPSVLTDDQKFKALLGQSSWFDVKDVNASTYTAGRNVCVLRADGMTNSEIDSKTADQGANPVATEVFVEDAETVYCPNLYAEGI